MEKSFDLGSVLRKHQKSHKYNPMQFETVALGVHRRLENNIKHRKSARLTGYDSIRNLPQPSPGSVAEPEQRIPDRRRQQLEKWKEEKEKKKQLAAKNKKKPFIVASSKPINPLKYEPVPKYEPSTSGCVTRSQSARNKKEEKTRSTIQTKSFAPKNARFHAPDSIVQKKVPKLAPVTTDKKNVSLYSFNSVLPTNKPAVIQTRSRAYNKIAAESKLARNTARDTRAKNAKPVSKLEKQKVVQSSSSSENEPSLMQTSASSSDVDLTKIVSSSSEENSNINSSTDNSSLKSLQSLPTSSTESDSEKLSPHNVTRKSILPSVLISNSTSHKSTRTSNLGKIMHTPKNPVPKSESSSEEKLRSPKSPVDKPMTPEQVSEEVTKISPCVTMSRGKDNARKEMLKKLGDGCFEEDESDMDDVEYFQRQLTSEIARITEICEVWDTIHQQVALPDPVQELVLAAVGQARLLMSQKMQQFGSLVQRCRHHQPPAPLVTPADLAGFWDMLFMQVENVDMRFKKLEELKARNWVEEKVALPQRNRVRAAPAPQRPRAAAAPTSRLRDMIAQARKAKSQKQSEEVQEVVAAVPSDEKTFDGGYFQVRSPARSPAPRTPVQRHSRSLLKAVLSNEAEKASASKQSASYAMMHASVLGKNVDCSIAGVEPLPQTPIPNLNATPGRSILKPAQEKSVKSTNKHIRKVVFDQSGTETDLNSSTSNDLTNSNTSDNTDTNSKELSTESEKDSNEIDLINFSMDLDGKEIEEEKENSKNVKKFIRQNAISSPETTEVIPRVMTRKMRKSMQSPMPLESPKVRSRKSKNQSPQAEEIIPNEITKSEKAKRSMRKSVLNEVKENLDEDFSKLDLKTPQSEKSLKRSTRKSIHTESVEHCTPKVVATPKSVKKSTRKKVLSEMESNVENPTPRRSTRNKKTDIPEMLGLA